MVDATNIINELQAITKECRRAISDMKTTKDLEELRNQYFGRKGKLTDVARKMGQLQPQDRSRIGQAINQARDELLMLAHEQIRGLND